MKHVVSSGVVCIFNRILSETIASKESSYKAFNTLPRLRRVLQGFKGSSSAGFAPGATFFDSVSVFTRFCKAS